jgi:predicted lipase
VWDEIEGELSTLACPVFYTGHSLGAALATLAASRHAPQAVYTFGSPRVGNEVFVASLQNLPIHRVVDDKDAAALLPPEALGFRHVGLLQLLMESESEENSFLFTT